MRRKLKLPPRPDDRLPMNMVVRSEDGPVSLLVDEIGDVLQPEEDKFEPPPENAPAASRKLLAGVYKLNDRLLLVLDPDRTLEIEEAPAGA
jgi:purine-binding chemotaxis protein CheW